MLVKDRCRGRKYFKTFYGRPYKEMTAQEISDHFVLLAERRDRLRRRRLAEKKNKRKRFREITERALAKREQNRKLKEEKRHGKKQRSVLRQHGSQNRRSAKAS